MDSVCITETVLSVADPPVGDPATATRSDPVFSCFLQQKREKKMECAASKAHLGYDRHPLTDFLDPPLSIVCGGLFTQMRKE